MAKKAKKAREADIDQKIRINEKKETLKEKFGMRHSEMADDIDPDLEEAFLDNIAAMESAGYVTGHEQLKRSGVDVVPPDRLSDAELSKKLAALIDSMAKRQIFLHHTNHLTDRELYEYLFERGLREEYPDTPVSPHGSFNIDPIGSWGDADMQIWLKFYATEKQRKKHKKEYPTDPIPPRAKPVSKRDEDLPQWIPQPLE